MPKLYRIAGSLLAAALLGGALPAAAQVDVQALLNDTQRVRQEGGRITVLWWIPNEFWEASAAHDPSTSKEQLRRLVGIVERYIVVAVVDGDINPVAGMKMRTLAEIAASIHVITPAGAKLAPLPESQMSQELNLFFRLMKPMIASILGQFGKALEFVVFDGQLPDGRRAVDPKGEGRFAVVMNNEKQEWRLPLGSLLPPAIDLKTGERFPGSYRFNPYTGDRLRAR